MTGILAQSAPGATTLTDLYTVPASKVVTGRILIANRAGAGDAYRIALSKDGDAIANEHYIAYDEPIGANASDESQPFMLGATDVVRVYAGTANLSFTLTGELRDS